MRLRQLGQIGEQQKPSLKASWVRKLTSRIVSYEEDFELFSLLYDVALARQISSLATVAAKQKIAPEEAASEMQNFDVFWQREQDKLHDVCRQQGLPNLYLTISPAEWKFPHHEGVLGWRKVSNSLSGGQATMTLHMRHVIEELLSTNLLQKGGPFQESGSGFKNAAFQERYALGVEEVYEYVIRWEFQGRGTLHAHILAWAKFRDGVDLRSLTGRSKQPGSQSALLQHLESTFNASVDVQCGDGHTALLLYVAGYVTKASDSLTFKLKDYRQVNDTNWRQTYLFLCKKAPLLPEMTLEFACLPLLECSFRSDTIYAPVPRTADTAGAVDQPAPNNSRALYEAYLKHQQSLPNLLRSSTGGAAESFLSWARKFTVVKTRAADGSAQFAVKARGGHGRGSNKQLCSLGVRFPYEMLDIFVGAWCATTVPHTSEAEFAPNAQAPEGAKYLQAALNHPRYKGDVCKLAEEIDADLKLRGKDLNQRVTVKRRLQALALLLDNTGARGLQIPASAWDARRAEGFPARAWSPKQTEMLEAVKNGVAVDDANL